MRMSKKTNIQLALELDHLADKLRHEMYEDLLRIGIDPQLPEDKITLRDLWNYAMVKLNREHALAEKWRDYQRHVISGAEVFGSDEFTGDR